MEKDADAGDAVYANFSVTSLHIFAQFCCVFEHFCKFCKFLHFFAHFCTFMQIFARIFCANISSSKIVSVLFFTLFPTLAVAKTNRAHLVCWLRNKTTIMFSPCHIYFMNDNEQGLLG